MEIDKSKPVLVTGATGYVASWLVKKLLEEGFSVNAAIRNPEKAEKIAHLNKIAAKSSGNIKYFKSDLLDKGSYHEAMQGCELVFHTASPFFMDIKDPKKELIEPAVIGTENVLEEANNINTVKRVVLTSSCAAIYSDCTDMEHCPNGIFTEEIWNNTSHLNHQPYSYSKTLAERRAWELVKEQNRWDMVVINPSLVMGPPLNPAGTTSESINLLKQMGDGTLRFGIPNIGIGMVDVRDLAVAHFNAGIFPHAKGRNIINAHNTSFLELAKALQSDFGKQYPIPKSSLPKWLLLMVGPMVNKSASRKFLRDNVNRTWKADNSKSLNELRINYRPLKKTMLDSFQALIDANMI